MVRIHATEAWSMMDEWIKDVKKKNERAWKQIYANANKANKNIELDGRAGEEKKRKETEWNSSKAII